jgi:hypothetical protein
MLLKRAPLKFWLNVGATALGDRLHRRLAAHSLADRFWQRCRDAHPCRQVAGIACSLVDWSGSALPVRSRPSRRTLAVGYWRQRLRCDDVDYRLVFILLVSR